VSSVAPPALCQLDQARDQLAPTGDTDRPFQKQVRTGGRKCPPTSATHCSPTTGETTCLYQHGPYTPGSSGQASPELETSPHHCPARDAPPLASSGLQALLEVQVEGSFSHAQNIPRDRSLDQADGKGQSPVGSRAHSRRIAQTGYPRLPAAPFRST
jgi:hypothetical protein